MKLTQCIGRYGIYDPLFLAIYKVAPKYTMTPENILWELAWYRLSFIAIGVDRQTPHETRMEDCLYHLLRMGEDGYIE